MSINPTNPAKEPEAINSIKLKTPAEQTLTSIPEEPNQTTPQETTHAKRKKLTLALDPRFKDVQPFGISGGEEDSSTGGILLVGLGVAAITGLAIGLSEALPHGGGGGGGGGM
jgi:hypothetical protein